MKRTIFEPDHEAFRESCRTFVDRDAATATRRKHIANHGFGRRDVAGARQAWPARPERSRGVRRHRSR